MHVKWFEREQTGSMARAKQTKPCRVKKQRAAPSRTSRSKTCDDDKINSKTRGASKRKYRYKSGTRALREIKSLQKKTNLLIPKLPFQRLVRDLVKNNSSIVTQIQSTALAALQVSFRSIFQFLINLEYKISYITSVCSL